MDKEKKSEQKLTVRFPPELLNELRVLAEENERSLNGEILWGLRFYVSSQGKPKTKRKDSS